MAQPFVSLLVPTRDRPELLRYCLRSLAEQSFRDFEVIVSDNFTTAPSRKVFEEIADERFTYVTPPSPLAMHDNWEFAADFARGEYVAVVIDKTVLRPSALERMHRVLGAMPAELVSWWNEGYSPVPPEQYKHGEYQPQFTPCAPLYFDARSELRARFAMRVRRGQEGVHYYRGKICFGAYHCNLVTRIKARTGRLFFAAIPDYTSMVAALTLTRSSVDLGEPLLISFNVALSTGQNASKSPAFLKAFLSQSDPTLAILDRLPIARLYSSLHNCVALEYLQMRDRLLPELKNMELELHNLALQAEEDLAIVAWTNDVERADQLAILSDFRKRHPPPTASPQSTQAPRPTTENSHGLVRLAKRLIVRVLGRRRSLQLKQLFARIFGLRHPDPAPYDSILKAARAADQFYRHTPR